MWWWWNAWRKQNRPRGTLLFDLKSGQLTSLAALAIGLALFVWVGLKGEKISVRKYSG